MNKKANVLVNSFYLLIVMVIFMFTLVISYGIFSGFNEKIQGLPTEVAEQGAKDLINSWGEWFLFFDKIMIFMFVVLWIGTMMAAIKSDSEHPVLFFISLISLFVLTIISVIITDFLQLLFTNTALITYFNDLTNTAFFSLKFHYFSFFIMVASLVYYFSKGSLKNNEGLV